jgi:hypothetical protein
MTGSHKKALQLEEVQGDVATGKGRVFAKQIVQPEVNFVDKKQSLAPMYQLPKPEKDEKLVRKGYTNNVSVLIDLKGQEFQFKAPLVTQPKATDLDIAHSVLDKMREMAHTKVEFAPEKPSKRTDEIAFLIKEQAKEKALANLRKKELLMLREGYGVEEIDELTASERERIIRKSKLPTKGEELMELFKEDRDYGGMESHASLSVGVNSVTDGPRTAPALSVPFMHYDAGSDAGIRDFMGRVPATGMPSAGFRTNTAPVTGSAMTRDLTTEGHERLRSAVRNVVADVARRERARGGTPVSANSRGMTGYSTPRYGPEVEEPPTPTPIRERNLREMMEYVAETPLTRGLRLAETFGAEYRLRRPRNNPFVTPERNIVYNAPSRNVFGRLNLA